MSNSACLNGGRDLVLHDLDAGPVADHLLAVLQRLDATHVETDRGVELQRPATGGGLRRAEHHADLLAQLVDEDHRRAGAVEGTGHLAQRLAHQPGLEADVAVAHLALDLGAGHERCHRVDDDQVERAGADQHVRDLERLLTGVGLRDQERVGVHPERLGVVGVERVLGVDERHDPARPLGVGHRVQGDRRLARGLGTVDLHHATAREPSDAERHVERDRARRDDLERRSGLLTQSHDRALAELPLDVGERGVQRLVAISTSHGCPSVCPPRGGTCCLLHRHRH